MHKYLTGLRPIRRYLILGAVPVAAFGLLLLLLWFLRSPGPAGVASAHPLATQAGIEILKRGGNAFDAAVAVSAALAVVEPAGSGLGGGGFWLLHDADEDRDVMLDGREKAPLAATRDMYLDQDGEVISGLSIDGALAAGIPGEPAALAWLAENHGELPLSASLAPAIRLATEGFVVDERYRRLAKFRLGALRASAAAAEIFLADGEPPGENARVVQPHLAETLRALASGGHDGFYRGEVAQKLVHGVRAAGGIWSLADLADYSVVVRDPVTVRYRDMKITSAALPSSGGLVMALALNILAGYDEDALALDGSNESDAPNESDASDASNASNAPRERGSGWFTLDYVHLLVEAMRRAYRDRAQYMGDGDFVEVPVERMLHPHYADGLRQSIRRDLATHSDALASTAAGRPGEGVDTTHFSIIDAAGNRVAATLSVNYPFGSGLVPPGTGVLLNDEMDDFSIKPGTPNVYGLVGAEANAIAGGKRMLSSMSPSFLEAGERVAVLGTPGGSRIISMLLLAALDFQRGAGAAEIVNGPRFHHQYLPDAIQFEPAALSDETLSRLRALGHRMDAKKRSWGNMHAVIRDTASGKISAASDRRGNGLAMVLE